MKLENLDEARKLNDDVERFKDVSAWQASIMRAEAELHVMTRNGVRRITVTHDEAAVIVDRREAELILRAEEIGVEL